MAKRIWKATWRESFSIFFLSCRIDCFSRILFILPVDLLGWFFTTDPWIQRMDLHNTDPTQLPHFFESSHRFFRLESTKRWHRTLGILSELLWVFSSLAFTFDSFPGVDRGRTSPKAQAESTTQTAGLAGRADWRIGRSDGITSWQWLKYCAIDDDGSDNVDGSFPCGAGGVFWWSFHYKYYKMCGRCLLPLSLLILAEKGFL